MCSNGNDELDVLSQHRLRKRGGGGGGQVNAHWDRLFSVVIFGVLFMCDFTISFNQECFL